MFCLISKYHIQNIAKLKLFAHTPPPFELIKGFVHTIRIISITIIIAQYSKYLQYIIFVH